MQTLGVTRHHPDCDGWRTDHRVRINVERTSSLRTPLLYRAACEECGPLHAGSFARKADAGKFLTHSTEVRCDGRCLEWK